MTLNSFKIWLYRDAAIGVDLSIAVYQSSNVNSLGTAVWNATYNTGDLPQDVWTQLTFSPGVELTDGYVIKIQPVDIYTQFQSASRICYVGTSSASIEITSYKDERNFDGSDYVFGTFSQISGGDIAVELTEGGEATYSGSLTGQLALVHPNDFTNAHTCRYAVLRLLTEDTPPPTDPTPAHEAVNVNLPISRLEWECEGDPDSYKVYFGTEFEGPELIGTVTTKYIDVDDQFIDPGLTYEWYVKAVYGTEEVDSELWTFDTEGIGVALGVPYSPTPADTATNVPLSTELLEWLCYTPDGQFGGAVTYDVYFNGEKIGNTNVKNIAMPRQQLAYNTTYSWYVVVRNSASSNVGPTWTFTTAALAESPVGGADGTRTKRLIAAADDKIWIEEL